VTDGQRGLLELDAEAMRALLAEVDERIQARNVKAGIYVVGGAAMSLAYGRDSVTADIDAIASHRAIGEEAQAIAKLHGLPRRWLNSASGGWVPPRPASARRRPTEPGLTVHVAPADHVLAMKLVALRRKDRPDIRLLIAHLGMAKAAPEDYADLLERVYAGEGRLATALGIPGDDDGATRREALAIGQWARDFAATLRNNPS
jgi:hypothetical protein